MRPMIKAGASRVRTAMNCRGSLFVEVELSPSRFGSFTPRAAILARNAVRVPSGISVRLRRNPHLYRSKPIW